MHVKNPAIVLGTIASVFLVAIAGCAADAGAPADVTAEGSLALDQATPTRAVGQFTKAGVTIGFELRREGGERFATITKASGDPIFESTIEDDGTHTTRLLGGRLVVEVAARGKSILTGDPEVQKELDASPEAPVFVALEPALAASGVERSLLPSATATASGIHTEDIGWQYAYPCGTTIGANQSVWCGTVFFGSTSLVVYNPKPHAECFRSSTTNDFAWVPSAASGLPGRYNMSGWYWGANILVDFPGYPLNYNSDAQIRFTH
jgi:hypothetical protein